MNRMQTLITATLFFTIAGCAAGEAASDRQEEKGVIETTAEGKALVLVELFTSQGCSSCPPADRVLSELGDGDGIIPIAFHVDYWNSLGWQDPFSSARWSTRQRQYARVMPTGRVYTPQAVIQGRQHCVGSRRGCVSEAVEEARRLGTTARLEGVLEKSEEGALQVAIAATSATEESLEAFVVLIENDLVTEIPRGENARRTLHNDHVVRRVTQALSLDGPTEANSAKVGRVTFELDPSWNRSHLGLVAFLQNPQSRAIQAVTRISTSPPSTP